MQVFLWVGLSTSGFLLRPFQPDKRSFKDQPLGTDAYLKQLQHHLRQTGLFSGETTHSLRRGTVIHDYQEVGKTPGEVGRRLQHVTPGGPQTMQYLDTSREVGCPPRQRRRLS